MKKLSSSNGKLIIYIILILQLFLFFTIIFLFLNKNNHLEIAILIAVFSIYILILLFGIYRINKITDIKFDTDFIYVDFEKTKISLNEIKKIKYRNTRPPFIELHSGKRYYFFVSLNEISNGKIKHELEYYIQSK